MVFEKNSSAGGQVKSYLDSDGRSYELGAQVMLPGLYSNIETLITEHNSRIDNYDQKISSRSMDRGGHLDLTGQLTPALSEEDKEKFKEEYGSMSSMSIGTILRKVIELESQGAENFFGELSFEIEDLIQLDRRGNGIINIIRLTDIQDRPKLFSTFMLSLLAEVYETFPEAGDSDKPKLCIFIDEAHLILSPDVLVYGDSVECPPVVGNVDG